MDDDIVRKAAADAAPPRLFDLVRDAIRRLHYSRRTEQTYLHWIRRFIFFRASDIRATWARSR